VQITYDAVKRAKTLAERGLDFEDAAAIFAGRTLTLLDERQNYPEDRYITAGFLRRRMVVVWTPTDDGRRIISMRYCHADEQALWRKKGLA
jgi:uncharacterized DUF497 family protein